MSWERFLTLQLSCFCLKFYPLILATYFSIYQLSLWWFSSGDFLFPFCLLLQGLLGDPLSIYVLISGWIHGYLFFGHDPILGPTVSSLATGGPLRLFSVFFWNTPSFFVYIYFYHVALQDAPGLYYIFLSKTWIRHFSKGPGSCKKQDVGEVLAIQIVLLLGNQRKIHVSILTMYMYVGISLYPSINKYIKITVHSYIFDSTLAPQT